MSVVVGEHLFELHGDPGRRARLVRFFQQSPRQAIVFSAESGFHVPQPFQIPDPFTRLQKVVEREVDPGGGRGAGYESLQRSTRASHKSTDSCAVESRCTILFVRDPLSLAFRCVGIHLARRFDTGRPRAQVTSSAVTGRVSDAHSLKPARIVRRELLSLAAHEQLLTPELLRHSLCAFRQFVTKTFPVGRRFGHPNHRFRRAEPQRQFHHLVGDHSLLVQFHGGGQRCPHRNGIHPQVVAQPVGFNHRIQIAGARVCTEGPGGFILWPFAGRSPVAWMHVN